MDPLPSRGLDERDSEHCHDAKRQQSKDCESHGCGPHYGEAAVVQVGEQLGRVGVGVGVRSGMRFPIFWSGPRRYSQR